MTDRVAYVNGKIVPENEASVSIRDAGFVYGYAVFDTARTFGTKLFRLEEHVDRLYQSLKYTRIDPGLSKAEMIAATENVVATNLPHLREGEDYWVTQRITSGIGALDGEAPQQQGATVVIESVPLPLRARASLFKDGIKAVVSSRRKTAPDALSPNAKTNNYMNMMLAQKEVSEMSPGGWALMLDQNGNIAEGAGCNFFMVRDGEVLTPTTEYILAGVSRQAVIELCQSNGIPVRETNISIKDAMTADEGFFTSTSLCVCPVQSFNAVPIGDQAVPGPITRKIMEAFSDLVDYDYVAQYLRFLGNSPASTGL